MAELRHRLFASIRDIPRLQWNALWPRQAEGYDFYLSQEEAGIKGFTFHYLALYAGEKPVLLTPLFSARFNMGLAMNDRWRLRLQNLHRFWPRLLVFQSLFCGAPTSEKGLVAIDPAWRENGDLFRALDHALLKIARECRAFMVVFKDFTAEDLETLAPMKSFGWFTGDGLPTAALDLPFDSVDAYLEHLSVGTRKDMKRKLKKTGTAVQIEAVHDIDHCIDDVFRLYKNVHDNGPMSWEMLTPAYFTGFCRNMPDNTVFFLYWISTTDQPRHLIGMNFCLQFEDRLIDKYIGMDYEVARDLNLYFVSFLNNVRWCIQNGLRTYVLSQGGYEVKLKLGARLIPLHTMTRIVNPFMNWFPARFSRAPAP